MAPSSGRSPSTGPEALAPASATVRARLATGVAAVGLLAVVLAAAGTPAPVRAPVVVLAALLLPGFPVVARMRVDLPTLLALDVVTSLALESVLATVTVKLDVWHPQVLGLVLAACAVGGTLVVRAHLLDQDAP